MTCALPIANLRSTMRSDQRSLTFVYKHHDYRSPKCKYHGADCVTHAITQNGNMALRLFLQSRQPGRRCTAPRTDAEQDSRMNSEDVTAGKDRK